MRGMERALTLSEGCLAFADLDAAKHDGKNIVMAPECDGFSRTIPVCSNRGNYGLKPCSIERIFASKVSDCGKPGGAS